MYEIKKKQVNRRKNSEYGNYSGMSGWCEEGKIYDCTCILNNSFVC